MTWTLTQADGIISGKTYTVTESGAAIEKYTKVTKIKANDGEEQTCTDNTETGVNASITATVDTATGIGTVEVTNTYTKLGSLTITKTVEGGVTEEEADGALTFVVEKLDEEGNVIGYLDADGNLVDEKVELTVSDFDEINKDEEGNITSIVKRFEGIEAGTYKVIETNTAIEGYRFEEKQSVTESGKVTVSKDEDGAADLKDVYELITVSVAVRKVWKDENNCDGKRPLKLRVNLMDGGKVVKTVELNESNGWMQQVKDLPKCDENGDEIEYTWEEVKEDLPAGYTFEGSHKDGNLTTLTNVYTPELTSVSVKKVWNDQSNAAGMRKPIQVQLYADGKPADVENPIVTLSTADGASHTWTGLKKYANGKKITYTVEELAVPEGYTMTRSGDAASGFVITNSIKLGKLEIQKKFEVQPMEEKTEELEELMDVTVRKVWDDNNNKDLNRPASITVHLYAGGKEIQQATLTEAGGWTYTFKDLPKYEHNLTVRYYVTEDPVDMYVSEINGFTIVNRYTPKLTVATVQKVWDDDGNAMKIRPSSIRMTLSNGTSVVLSANNGWSATVTNLPAVVDGKPVTYSWTEQEVPGYRQTGKSTSGTTTMFTNKVFSNLIRIPADQPQPDLPGARWYIFEEYDTALGGQLLINHVGDCFD